MAPTQEQLEFLNSYVAELKDLTVAAKPKIVMLSMLAEENKDLASSVAAAVEKHILSCPPPMKLCALYLMDSIVRSPDIAADVRAIYAPLFARNLAEVFIQVWESLPERQVPLLKLLGCWRGHFPDRVLDIIRCQVESGPAGRAQQATGAPDLASQPHSATVPVAAAQPTAVRPQVTSLAIPRQPGVMPAAAGYGPRPAAGPLPNPVLLSPQQARAATPPLAPVTTGVSTMRPQYHQGPWPASNGGPAPYQPQQQFGAPHQQAPQQQQPAYPAPYQPSTAYQAPPAVPVAQPAPGDVNHLLASLLQSGMLSAALSAPPQPAQSLRSPQEQGQALPPPPARRHRTTEFTAEVLKERDEALIQALLASTEASRAAQLDRQFRQRRKQQSAKKASRQWYVNLDAWMAGTTTDPHAEPDFFADEAAAEAAKPKQEFSEPADDAQPNCALSGEKFVTFWDDKREEWRYRNAKSLDAEEAARYGLLEGSLVLASCLGPPSTGADLLNTQADIVQASQQEQSVAADLAAAAAANAEEASALIQEFLEAKLAELKPQQAQQGGQEEAAGPSQPPMVKPEPQHASIKAEPQQAQQAQQAEVPDTQAAAGVSTSQSMTVDTTAVEAMEVGEGGGAGMSSRGRAAKRKSEAISVKAEPLDVPQSSVGALVSGAAADAAANGDVSPGATKRIRTSSGLELGDHELHFEMLDVAQKVACP